jgi:ribosomal protein S18 acetylase RimI-like enzyme
MSTVTIVPYRSEYFPAIQHILRAIGWAEQYVIAAEANAAYFAQHPDCAACIALLDAEAVGFLYVQYYQWNRLAQIQGLAVDPAMHRKGVASALVAQAEAFAREHGARGIYVDTPVSNQRGRPFYEAVGYQFGYVMPRYYADALDGVTYQKFFDETK